MRSFLPTREQVMRGPRKYPKLPPELRLRPYCIRLTERQIALLHKLGARRFRAWLDSIDI